MPRARKKLSNNLNVELTGRRKAFVRGNTTVLFRPDHIVAHLKRKILAARYVVGCVAWISNPCLLEALKRCRGVSLVVNYDRKLIRKHREEYHRLTPMEGAKSAVHCDKTSGVFVTVIL